jgi:hypothetical protein
MAGQATKKLQRTKSVRMQYFQGISVLSFLFHIVIIWLRDGDFPLIRASLCSCLKLLSVWMIDTALSQALEYELWQDLFIVTVSAEILSGFWSHAIWLLLAIPGYGLYVWGGKALQMLASIGKSDPQEPVTSKSKPK